MNPKPHTNPKPEALNTKPCIPKSHALETFKPCTSETILSTIIPKLEGNLRGGHGLVVAETAGFKAGSPDFMGCLRRVLCFFCAL